MENLLGVDPNWPLHNLVLTLAAYMEAEPLLLLEAFKKSFQGLKDWEHSEEA